MKNFVDYYSILEIGFPSDELEIKRQFKKLAKIIHPDLNSSVDATSKMRLLLEAYEILSSYSKKKFYDAQYAFLILKKKNGFSVREKKSARPIVVNAFEHEDLLVQPSIILSEDDLLNIRAVKNVTQREFLKQYIDVCWKLIPVNNKSYSNYLLYQEDPKLYAVKSLYFLLSYDTFGTISQLDPLSICVFSYYVNWQKKNGCPLSDNDFVNDLIDDEILKQSDVETVRNNYFEFVLRDYLEIISLPKELLDMKKNKTIWKEKGFFKIVYNFDKYIDENGFPLSDKPFGYFRSIDSFVVKQLRILFGANLVDKYLRKQDVAVFS